jgi:hypothetical protein
MLLKYYSWTVAMIKLLFTDSVSYTALKSTVIERRQHQLGRMTDILPPHSVS